MSRLDGAVGEIRGWLAEIPIDPEEDLGPNRRKRAVDPVALDAVIGSYIRRGPSGLKKAWGLYKIYYELGVAPTQWTFEFLLEGCSTPSPSSPFSELVRSPEYLKREFAMYLVAEMAQKRELALEKLPKHGQDPVTLPMPSLGTYEKLVLICINLAERRVEKKFVDPPTPIPYPPLVAPRHTPRPPQPPSPQSPSYLSPSNQPHAPGSPSGEDALLSSAQDAESMTEAQSLTDAFEYLHEMTHQAGYRPRQWLLRRILRCCMYRDDERAGWVLAEMERWGYADDTQVSAVSGGGLAISGSATLGGMKEESDMVVGFWRRAPVEGSLEAKLGVGMGRGKGKGKGLGVSWEKGEFGWVRCGRRSRREGGKWKG